MTAPNGADALEAVTDVVLANLMRVLDEHSGSKLLPSALVATRLLDRPAEDAAALLAWVNDFTGTLRAAIEQRADDWLRDAQQADPFEDEP